MKDNCSGSRSNCTATAIPRPPSPPCACIIPRESYLRYLPAVYAADDESRWFLERFLALFQTDWDDLERRIDTYRGYFDPAAVPDGAALAYLAGWLDLPLEAAWTDQQRRRLLVAAPQIYAQRGTLPTVRRYLQVYLENIRDPSGTDKDTPPPPSPAGCPAPATAGPDEPFADGYPIIVEGFPRTTAAAVQHDGRGGVGGGAAALGAEHDRAAATRRVQP